MWRIKPPLCVWQHKLFYSSFWRSDEEPAAPKTPNHKKPGTQRRSGLRAAEVRTERSVKGPGDNNNEMASNEPISSTIDYCEEPGPQTPPTPPALTAPPLTAVKGGVKGRLASLTTTSFCMYLESWPTCPGTRCDVGAHKRCERDLFLN